MVIFYVVGSVLALLCAGAPSHEVPNEIRSEVSNPHAVFRSIHDLGLPYLPIEQDQANRIEPTRNHP